VVFDIEIRKAGKSEDDIDTKKTCVKKNWGRL
jgi:hypothetical protein